MCTQFNGGDGCYDRVLDYVNTQIGVVPNKEEQATAQATEAAAEAASETNKWMQVLYLGATQLPTLT